MIMAVKMLMKGAVLPGNSTVELKDFEIPVPGHGQVLIQTKATTICGSDIRAIYREHLGKGPEGYQNKIAGHEPSGQIVKCGPGMRRFKEGDRVVTAGSRALLLGMKSNAGGADAHAGVVAGISFVKNFDGVVPQRRILGGSFSRFAQAGFKVA